MVKRRILSSLMLLLVPAISGAALANENSARSGSSPVSLQTSFGFTGSPATFLMAVELPYGVTDHFSLGPAMQLGVKSELTLFTFSANARYAFDLSQALSESEASDKLRPFVQGGLGLAHYSVDVPGGDIDDTGFLLQMGFGFDYYFTQRIALGSNMIFNVVPTEVLGDRFFFSWQVASLRFHF